MIQEKSKIQEAFERFDNRHPEVYELFVKFVREILAAGHNHYSAHAILLRIRWHYDIDPDHNEDFKLNNNYSSRYARKFVEDYPMHKDFFTFRSLTA